MGRLIEIIEDENGRLSSTRVVYLFVTLVLCWIAVNMEIHGRTNDVIIGILAAMGAGTYGISKWNDTSTQRTRIRAEAQGDANV
jgi:uncharacterized membrane protein